MAQAHTILLEWSYGLSEWHSPLTPFLPFLLTCVGWLDSKTQAILLAVPRMTADMPISNSVKFRIEIQPRCMDPNIFRILR